MTEKSIEESIVRNAQFANWVAVLAIAFSASAITWSVSETKNMQKEIDQLHEEVDVLAMREAKNQATLDVYGVQIE